MIWLMIFAAVVGALVWGLVFDQLDRRKKRTGE
jgi:hypothetical protein